MRPNVPTVCYTLDAAGLLPAVVARRRRLKQAAEEYVRREVDHEDEEKVRDGEVRGSGAVGAMQEGIFDGEIEILLGGDEARGDQDGQQDGGLQFPAAAIVAEAGERPEQDKGQDDVEKREQASPERSGGVEEIFGAADQVVAEEKSSGHVEGPHQVNKYRGDGLAGNQQRVVGEQADAGEDYGDVAEMQEIREAPGVPVGSEPDREPQQRDPAEPIGDFLAWCW
jgi:hypothetical protein